MKTFLTTFLSLSLFMGTCYAGDHRRSDNRSSGPRYEWIPTEGGMILGIRGRHGEVYNAFGGSGSSGSSGESASSDTTASEETSVTHVRPGEEQTKGILGREFQLDDIVQGIEEYRCFENMPTGIDIGIYSRASIDCTVTIKFKGRNDLVQTKINVSVQAVEVFQFGFQTITGLDFVLPYQKEVKFRDIIGEYSGKTGGSIAAAFGAGRANGVNPNGVGISVKTAKLFNAGLGINWSWITVMPMLTARRN